MAQKKGKSDQNRLYELVDDSIKSGLTEPNLQQILQLTNK